MIKFIRYSFRESEFDEVQNALLVRENIMENKMENLVKDCASLKKQIDLLEKTESFTVLEKCSAEEKLGRTQKRCEKLDKETAEMREKIRILRCAKLGIEEKLESSHRKCKEMEEKLMKMEKEMEDLRRDKINANKAMEELERKLKNAEANQTSIEEEKRKRIEAESRLRNVEENLEKALKTMEEAKKREKEMLELRGGLHLDAFNAPITEKNKKQKNPAASQLSHIADYYFVLVERFKNVEVNGGVQELKLKNVEDNRVMMPCGLAKKGSNGSGIQLGGAVEADLIVISEDSDSDSDDETCIPRTNKRNRTE